MLCTFGRVFENYMRLKIKRITHELFLRKAASRKRFLNVSRFVEARRGILEYQATSYFLSFTYFKKPPHTRMPLYFHQKSGELRINLCCNGCAYFISEVEQ